MKSLQERLKFFGQFLKNLRNVGAVFPASKALAQEMVSAITPRSLPVRVLEVGGGPGNISEAVLSKLRPQDELWIVELNPEFCKMLRERFIETTETRKSDWPKVHVFEGPLQSFKTDEAFDFIVSSLPLNAFTPELIQDLWHCMRSLLKSGGVLTFYEYWGVRGLRFVWPGSAERQRLAQVSKLFAMTITPVVECTKLVIQNLPPAKVHQVVF